jgi:sugar phosphate isomerase/epimerase
MKIAIALSVQPTGFPALAIRGDLAGNLREVAALGYDGVELALRDPRDIDTEEVGMLCARYNLEIVALATGQVYVDEGLSLTQGEPAIRERALERFLSFIDLAAVWKTRVIVGLIRGRGDHSMAEGFLLQALKKCCAEAEGKGVGLLLEPLNRYETELINTTSEALELINKIGLTNLKLLLDTFHMNIEEVNLGDAIRGAKPSLAHLHVADSNRHAPGWGHIDFAEVISALKDIEYRGYVSAEILPFPSSEAAAEAAITNLKKMGFK